MLTRIEAANKNNPMKAIKELIDCFGFFISFVECNIKKHLLASEAANKLKKGND